MSTHKLNEIMAVADRCTVLRKGKYMGTVDIKDTTKEELSRMMVGRDVHSAHILALAQNRAAICHCHDLVELVGDEEDGFAFLLEPAHDLHQLVDLLRGQNSGGLISDISVGMQQRVEILKMLYRDNEILIFDEPTAVLPLT